MKWAQFAILGLLGCLVAVPSSAATYECKLKSHTRNGWISPVLILILNPEMTKAAIYDYYVKKSYGEPIPALVSRMSANKLRFEWSVNDIKVSNINMKASFDAKATFDLRDNKMRLRVFIRGSPTDAHGSGKCEVVKPGKRKKKK